MYIIGFYLNIFKKVSFFISKFIFGRFVLKVEIEGFLFFYFGI